MTTATYGQSTELAQMKPHELLLLLGGLLSIALGAIVFGLAWSQGIPSTQMTNRVTVLAVDVALGIALWAAWPVAHKNSMNGGIVALIAAIVLLAFGGQAGLVGGIVGLLAGVLAIALPYLPARTRS